MPLITEDEVRRVVNNLADGKAKGVDGWIQRNLERYPEHTSKGSRTFSTKLNNNILARRTSSYYCTHPQRRS
eukprot:11686613-Heterocapsa_arctica.AAC.1